MKDNPGRWGAIMDKKGKLSLWHNTYVLEVARRRKYHSPHLDKIFDRIVEEYGIEYPQMNIVFLDRRYVENIEFAFDMYAEDYIIRKGKIIKLVGEEDYNEPSIVEAPVIT